MSLKIGFNDQFENEYKSKFQVEASKYGIPIFYDKDRAAIDIGLQLITNNPNSDTTKLVASTRVWFQLKGKTTSSLTREQFDDINEIEISIRIDHLKFWYSSPEAVYIAVYVKCVDKFYIEDIYIWGQISTLDNFSFIFLSAFSNFDLTRSSFSIFFFRRLRSLFTAE